MKTKFEQIINEIVRDGEFKEIIKGMTADKNKQDFLFGDFLYWAANHQTKVIEAHDKKYLKYLFIRIINININGKNTDYKRLWGLMCEGMYNEECLIVLPQTDNEESNKDKILIEDIFDNMPSFINSGLEERIFKLYYQQGFSTRKTAKILNMSHSNVFSKIKAIRIRIKEFYNVK